jgi:hypothetical protein
MTSEQPTPTPNDATSAEPSTSAEQHGWPKDDYTEQMSEEWLDSLGEGARREMLGD